MNPHASHLPEDRPSIHFKSAGSGRLLRLRGPDSVDLLQRISASEFVRQEDARSFWSLFTNAKGRIVDLALAAKEEGEVFLLAGEGHGALLEGWIESFIITEEVELSRDASTPSLSLRGEGAASVLARALGLGGELGGEPMERGGFQRARDWFAFAPHGEAAIHLAGPADDELERRLLAAGARPLAEADLALEEILRGYFRPGLDLNERFHPLEVGLEEVVSWDKGCYVGQEVVARLKHYDKVRRSPAILRAAATARATGELRIGDRACGQLVRIALQPEENRRVALAVVEKTLDEGAVLCDEDGAKWELVSRPRGTDLA